MCNGQGKGFMIPTREWPSRWIGLTDEQEKRRTVRWRKVDTDNTKSPKDSREQVKEVRDGMIEIHGQGRKS